MHRALTRIPLPTMAATLAVILSFVLVACSANGQDSEAVDPDIRFLTEGVTPPDASLDDLDWFVGLWEGEVFGGIVEHRVMAAHNGHMPGLVRIRAPETDAVSMYELSSFILNDGSLTYRNRHFGADLVAYQEPEDVVDRPLVAMEDGAAYFHGITFAQTGDDTSVVAFMLTDDAGAQTKHLVYYTRK